MHACAKKEGFCIEFCVVLASWAATGERALQAGRCWCARVFLRPCRTGQMLLCQRTKADAIGASYLVPGHHAKDACSLTGEESGSWEP